MSSWSHSPCFILVSNKLPVPLHRREQIFLLFNPKKKKKPTKKNCASPPPASLYSHQDPSASPSALPMTALPTPPQIDRLESLAWKYSSPAIPQNKLEVWDRDRNIRVFYMAVHMRGSTNFVQRSNWTKWGDSMCARACVRACGIIFCNERQSDVVIFDEGGKLRHRSTH